MCVNRVLKVKTPMGSVENESNVPNLQIVLAWSLRK